MDGAEAAPPLVTSAYRTSPLAVPVGLVIVVEVVVVVPPDPAALNVGAAMGYGTRSIVNTPEAFQVIWKVPFDVE